MPDDVQPEEGQGDDGAGGLFDSYLSTVPEDGRETVESYLKDASKQVEKVQEEAAGIKKNWEQYEPVKDDLSAYTPEQLSELLAWHREVTSDDEAFKNWVSKTSDELGLSPKEEKQLEDEAEQQDLTPKQVQDLAAQIAEERLGPINERFDNFEKQQAITAEEAKVRDRIQELEAEQKTTYSEQQKAIIFDLGKDSPEDDWVGVGHGRYLEIVGASQKDFVDEKSKAPAANLNGGGREQFKPSTDFKVVEAQAKERLRQMQT